MNDYANTWRQELTKNTGLDLSTVEQYVNDVRRFDVWMAGQERGRTPAEVTP